ncbi:MAG TPA: TM2 domain-containing protein [Micromonosporaceae bacterium]|nr:TM2 domain-containing protein [Micromonosporaceae bacterium]
MTGTPRRSAAVPSRCSGHGRPGAVKSRIAAGVLQIVLPFGVGRFYTGHMGIGLAQLLTVFIGVGVIWSMIDGVLLLVHGGTDGRGRPLRL